MALFSRLFVLLAVSALAFGDKTFVELFLSARNLPDADVCCSQPVYPSDAYAKLSYAPSDFDAYVHQFDTGVVDNNPNPEWTELFQVSIDDVLAGSARIRVDVYDADSPDADDNLGFAEIHIRDIINGFGHTVEKTLSGGETGGTLVVRGRVNGTRSVFDKAFDEATNIIQIPIPAGVPTISRLVNQYGN